MSETAAPDTRIPARLARLVARIVAEPAALAEHRGDVRTLTKALKKSQAELGLSDDGQLRDGPDVVRSDDEALQSAITLLASRLQAFGVERLVLSDKATEADLFDLVKLLATAPDQADPPAFFAARAAAVDARAIPRTLRKLASAEIVEAASVKEPGSVKEPASVKAPRASGSQPVVTAAPAALAAPAASTDTRSDRLVEALAVPDTADAELRELFSALQATADAELLRDPLDRITLLADMAFRTGRFERMVEAIAGLVAIEHDQLERDASDERRREFARALRRLATPVILRQLAIQRRSQASHPTAARQLQAILQRYGTDGAEAVIDEWVNAATPEARAVCLDALRHMSRTHDALFDMVRHTDDLRVRQGVELLGALGDARAEQLLLEQLRHPDTRTRREVIAALERFPSLAALEAIGVGLTDDEAIVRLRAVAAVVPRGQAAVKLLVPLLDGEADREVLYAAIAGLGSVGGSDAVQALIKAANGETQHPRRRGASYRLQACAALAQIRTPQAMAAVQVLRDDRDREVREGAMRLVAQAARRGTTAMRVVADA